jgi:peptide/nickel transport system substrate-binding protein
MEFAAVRCGSGHAAQPGRMALDGGRSGHAECDCVGQNPSQWPCGKGIPMSKRLLAAAVAFTAIAAGPALADKRDNTVRFAYDQVIENVDPYFNNVRLGVILGANVWDTLIYRDPETNEYKGQLATSWKWIDNKTLELELRKGVKFHNGEDFDADDVAFTLNFASDPANKSTQQTNIKWIDKVEKLDQYKVRIHTKEVFPAALEYLAGPLVIHPNEYYAKVGPRGMNEKPVGSGPYRFVEHILGKSIKLEKNPNPWAGSNKAVPKIDKVEIRMIPDRQTQVAEVLSGGMDLIMSVDYAQAQQLKAAPQVVVQSGGTMRIVFLLFNAGPETPAKELLNLKVRQAIAHAIDKETMAKTLVGEGAPLLDAICFPTQVGCDTSQAAKYEYDPAKAKKLLAEAGFGGGLTLTLMAYRERPQTEAMINYLRAVGINAELKYMQYAAMREQHRANKAPITHQTWGSFNVNDVSASTSAYFKGLDDDMTRDPEVIALLTKGDTSIDPKVRTDAYRQAHKLITERAYAVPLYALVTWYVQNKDLSFKPYPDELPRFYEMSWK